jgi:hypothetical protein
VFDSQILQMSWAPAGRSRTSPTSAPWTATGEARPICDSTIWPDVGGAARCLGGKQIFLETDPVCPEVLGASANGYNLSER